MVLEVADSEFPCFQLIRPIVSTEIRRKKEEFSEKLKCI